MDAPRSDEPAQYLTFFLAGEEYALGILEVREILELGPLTRVPGAPPFVRGVMNLRGIVVPVIDLAAKLGLPETPVTKWTCIVLVDAGDPGSRTVLGVMADSVHQVIDLAPERIEPPPSFGTRVRTDYLMGMGRVGSKFVLLLDVERALSMDELHVDEATIGGAPDADADADTDATPPEAPGWEAASEPEAS